MANTTISISKSFRDWLQSKGKKGESYEEIIKSMLKPEFSEGPEQGEKEDSNVEPDSRNIDNSS